MADVKFPVAISSFALYACSKAMLHITLLDTILSDLSKGGSEINCKSSLSSSADFESSELITVLPAVHNAKLSGALTRASGGGRWP